LSSVQLAERIPSSWLALFGVKSEDRDPDKDGFRTADEYIAGTDPTDGEDYLRIEECVLTTCPDGIIIRWQTARGRTYAVYSADMPFGPWTNAVYTLHGNGSKAAYTNPCTQPGQFMRVGVRYP